MHSVGKSERFLIFSNLLWYFPDSLCPVFSFCINLHFKRGKDCHKQEGFRDYSRNRLQYKNDQWCKEKSTDLRLEIWVQNLFLPLVSHGHLVLAFPSLSLKVG